MSLETLDGCAGPMTEFLLRRAGRTADDISTPEPVDAIGYEIDFGLASLAESRRGDTRFLLRSWSMVTGSEVISKSCRSTHLRRFSMSIRSSLAPLSLAR